MYKISKMSYANIGQFLSDFVFLFLAFAAAYGTTRGFVELQRFEEYSWVLIVYIPFWMFYMGTMGMYNKTTFNYYDRILRHVLIATLISGILVGVLFYLSRSYYFSRMLFGTYIIYSVVLLLFERFLFLQFVRSNRETSNRRALIVGTRELIEKFEYYLMKTQILLSIEGYLRLDDDHPIGREGARPLEDLPVLLKDSIIDEVIIAIPKDYISRVEKYMLLCEEMGITVRLLLDLYDLKVSKINLNSVGPLPMITYHTVSLNDIQLLGKRVMDILGSAVGLLITGVLSIFIIPLIKLDSPGPIFFKQDRVGLNGRIFKLYKFRTMYTDAEARKAELMARNEFKGGMMFKMKDDPRSTRLGKFLRKTSLDELPQFFNVIKGDMSLVGTRPPTTDEVSRYLNGHWRRISIKPGITGLWQVSGRSSIMDFDEVVRLDTDYIDEWSITQDIKIILKTFPAVIARRGAM